MASDILFSSPTIIPGDESADPYVADVLVSDGLIAQIGASGSINSRSARKVDAKGCFLTPGFIDMHAHSDLYLLSHPEHEPKITQGCTVRFCKPIGCLPGQHHVVTFTSCSCWAAHD